MLVIKFVASSITNASKISQNLAQWQRNFFCSLEYEILVKLTFGKDWACCYCTSLSYFMREMSGIPSTGLRFAVYT